jgi:DNA repair exonuclease SbcCD ATPase subunit
VAAELARARGAVQAHDDERRALDRRLAELAGQIGALADQGIEEALAETRGRLAAARSALAAQEAELAALQRLRAALEGARAAARTAYFAPVVEELRPLLSLLHPEAGVAFDDATLLPAALERDGQSEGLEILSGGTREQVAVLTRLAFARLLARQGRSVPVILDDALVQTDDARIEAMFTALHRSAQAQQVIVLTCRQRAFAALGGHHLAFETVA